MQNSLSVQTQFSIFLINKPGILSKACQELGRAKINIVAMTMMDSMEHGVLRLVTDGVEQTREVLGELNIPMTETDVLSVQMPNRPGAMADICSRLADAHVSVSYAYCTTGSRGGKTVGVFKVGDLKKAAKILSSTKVGSRDQVRVVRRNRGRR